MTIIIGLEHGGKVYMGGDSGASDGYVSSVVSAPKVFKNGPFLIGFTTSFRMGQLLQYGDLEFSSLPDKNNVNRFLTNDFVDRLRQMWTDRGWMGEDEEKREKSGLFLLGFMGCLYRVDLDFQVGRNLQGYDAIGSADQVALGAMYGTRKTSKPDVRIRAVLEACGHVNAHVRPPYYVENL